MANKKGTQKQKPTSLEVKIDRLMQRGDTSIKALASITIGDYAVHGFKVMESQKGLFVAMPSTSYVSGGDTKYRDTFHPVTAQAREELIERILGAYEQALETQEKEEQQETASEEEEEEPQMTQTM